MFDDLFLFGAARRSPDPRNVLLLSLREHGVLNFFDDHDWQIFIRPDLMVAKTLYETSVNIEIITGAEPPQPVSLIAGDLAAYSDDMLELVERLKPRFVKADYVTSPLDGQAFVLVNGADQMKGRAVSCAAKFLDMGYSVLTSTWYRNDAHLITRRLVNPEEIEQFPCNLIGFREAEDQKAFEDYEHIFRAQEKLFSGEHHKLVRRLNAEVDKSKSYITMLEDAMIALQPSDKIKL